VGRYVTAEILGRILDDAKRKKVDVVILEIDSPGGDVLEAESIIKLLGERREIRLVACVRRAISAAAPIAMTCKEIYFFPPGTIGGAVPFQLGPDNTPRAVEEKFQSVWRAACRNAAEIGGHSPLLAEGMINPDVVLGLIEQDGNRTVVEGEKGKTIKTKGKILTLTSQEAVACGLATGIIRDYPSLGDALNLARWVESGGAGRVMMGAHVAQVDQVERQRNVRIRVWRKYQAIAPELGKVEDELKLVGAEGRAAEATRALLMKQYDSQLQSIESAYKNNLQVANAVTDPTTSSQFQAQAKAIRDTAIAGLKGQMQPQAAANQDKINRLQEHYLRLQGKMKDLLATLSSP
jgi:hypothetical protein